MEPSTTTASQMFMPPMNPYMFSAPWFPPVPMTPYGNLPGFQVPATPQPTTVAAPPSYQPLKRELPPSSPPDDSAFLQPFPAIRTFLEGLCISNPLRKLETYADIFESNDYYDVDEIAGITYERLTTGPFNMTPGNAEFLLKEIERDVKRIKRIREKDRKRARNY
jgi:hypothetical protein